MMRADADARQRFLVLLASLDDRPALADDGRVSVGPRIVRSHLRRPVILALAFAVATDDALAPCGDYPGNLRATAMVAHASGVEWANGRGLGPDVVSLPWTTGLVLLAELPTSAALLRSGLPRLDRAAGVRPSVGEIPPAEGPIVLGCDYELQQALADGRGAVREYLTAVIRGRALAAATLLES